MSIFSIYGGDHLLSGEEQGGPQKVLLDTTDRGASIQSVCMEEKGGKSNLPGPPGEATAELAHGR